MTQFAFLAREWPGVLDKRIAAAGEPGVTSNE